MKRNREKDNDEVVSHLYILSKYILKSPKPYSTYIDYSKQSFRFKDKLQSMLQKISVEFPPFPFDGFEANRRPLQPLCQC